jgi:hypothetical protein
MAFLVRRQALSSGHLPYFFDPSFFQFVFVDTPDRLSQPLIILLRAVSPGKLTLAVPLVSQSQSLTLLLLSFVPFAFAASLQSGGGWREFSGEFRIEAREDMLSLSEDIRLARYEAISAPADIKRLWADVSYRMIELRAAARADTTIAATQFSGRGKNR